ncbi:glycosyltransferase family 39 protein [Candidatus Sumerlaeota bacterium]
MTDNDKVTNSGETTEGGESPQPKSKYQTLAIFLGLLGMVLLVYLPALGAGFVWDDNAAVTRCMQLRSLEGLREFWTDPGANPAGHYFPLTYTTFWLEYQFYGDNPFGYHLLNVILHAINSLLVFLLLRRLAVPGALLAAAIFAVHPLHVESVAWIAERKDVLSALFYLLAALSYLRFIDSRRWPYYALTFALFVAALLSKSIVVSFPFAAFLMLLWLKKGKGFSDIIALLLLVITAAVFVNLGLRSAHYVAYTWEYSLLERCLIAGRALWFYIGKLIWPAPLMAIYPRWEIDAGAAWQYLFPAAALLAPLGLGANYRKIGWGPLVAFVYFTLTVGLALGFVDFQLMDYTFVADRFQYLAGIGLIALFAATVTQVGATLPKQVQRAGTVALGVLLLTYGALTFRQARLYESNETLFRHTVAHNPDSANVHNQYAIGLNEVQDYEGAIEHFEESLRLYSDAPYIRIMLGDAQSKVGKIHEALANYLLALELDPVNPYPALGALRKLERATGDELKDEIEAYWKARAAQPEPDHTDHDH